MDLLYVESVDRSESTSDQPIIAVETETDESTSDQPMETDEPTSGQSIRENRVPSYSRHETIRQLAMEQALRNSQIIKNLIIGRGRRVPQSYQVGDVVRLQIPALIGKEV